MYVYYANILINIACIVDNLCYYYKLSFFSVLSFAYVKGENESKGLEHRVLPSRP